MNPTKLARAVLLWFALPGLVISTALQVVLQVYGNESVGPEQARWSFWLCVTFAALCCCIEFALGMMLLNGRRVFRGHYPGMVVLAGCICLFLMSANLYFVRSAFERTLLAQDETIRTNAELVAWMETRDELEAAWQQAQRTPPWLEAHAASIIAKRNEIARLVKDAQNMDNDGRADNDKLIPGEMAKIESLKADLPNLENMYATLRAEHQQTIDSAYERLAAHRAQRGTLMASNEQAGAEQHQFVRFGADLATMIGSLWPSKQVDSDAATNWVLTIMAIVVLSLNYGCGVLLKGWFLLGEIMAADARDVQVETPPLQVPDIGTNEIEPEDLTQSTPEEDVGSKVIAIEFRNDSLALSPPARALANWAAPLAGEPTAGELKRKLREARNMEILDPKRYSSAELGNLTHKQKLRLVHEEIIPFLRQQGIAA